MSELIQRNPLADLLQGRAQYPEPASDGLKQLRARALERANALTVPTTRDEDWRFTDLAPLFKSSYQPVRDALAMDVSQMTQFLVPEAVARLVFVDGHYAPVLSRVTDLPKGFSIGRPTDALGSIAPFESDPFVALNTSFLRDAAVIRADRNVECAAPIHVLFVSTQQGGASYPRMFVSAATGARVTVIEDHVSLTPGAVLVDVVTEIEVDSNACVCHIKLQRQPTTQFHIGHLSVRLAQDAHFASHSVTLGARLSRNNLHVSQMGTGAQCTLGGLALLNGRQHADTHSTMDHAQPHGQSEQMHRCIVDGAARAVFSGKIFVRAGAQRTNASQQSRNLLLSERARVDTKPQLEIYADDVKCAHGATVGQLEADELFYLRSRGLSELVARSLLTYAFAAEVIERIPVKSIVQRLEDDILQRTLVGASA